MSSFFQRLLMTTATPRITRTSLCPGKIPHAVFGQIGRCLRLFQLAISLGKLETPQKWPKNQANYLAKNHLQLTSTDINWLKEVWGFEESPILRHIQMSGTCKFSRFVESNSVRHGSAKSCRFRPSVRWKAYMPIYIYIWYIYICQCKIHVIALEIHRKS